MMQKPLIYGDKTAYNIGNRSTTPFFLENSFQKHNISTSFKPF